MNSHRATLSLTETSTKQAACPTTGSFISLTAEWISQSRNWTPGKILMLELNTAPSDGKVLPAGTFNVLNPMEITAAASLTPFTVVPGLAAEDGSIYGTWYLATDTQGGDFQPLCAAQKGTVSVKKTGDTYTIDFDITDDDFKISVKGSYTGKPYIHDGTANTTSVSTRTTAASGKALNIHKSARRQAFRK